MTLRFTFFAVLILRLLAPRGFAADATAIRESGITAKQVVERMQKESGVPWRTPTVDTFKAGDPETPVKGIAVVMMSTLDVLQRAVAAGANLIITHEPTYFSGQDVTGVLENENDPVYAAKLAFIKEHNLVIFRFHDHLHRMDPDPVLTGFASRMGWQKFQPTPATPKFTLPATTLEALASDIKTKFGIRTLRFVGDPTRKFTKVAFSPGASGFAAHRKLLQQDDVEVLVFGEGTEWETMEYASDAISQGRPKALILMGHIPSEESGMIECTRWLKTFVTGVPIEFIVTPEPFSMPAKQPASR